MPRAPCWITAGADARRLHHRRPSTRLGLGAPLGLGAARRRRCSPASCCARPGRRKPLLPLRVFRSRNVSGANVVQVLMVAGMFGMFFLGTLYMQQVLGYDALQIGLALPARRGRDRHACRSASRPG